MTEPDTRTQATRTFATLDRRAFLRRLGIAGAGAALAPALVRDPAAAQADPTLAPFLHGVASGDPLPDGVVIWTRVTTDQPGPVPVDWLVARDLELTDVVASGTANAGVERDFTVKIDVAGLAPGTWYFYAFEALGTRSLIGRTKTAPSGAVERLRFGVVSCSNYQAGFFNAYAALAERHDLDAVLHLGDYLYEGGASAGARTNFAEDRSHRPENEIVALADYRQRYAQYRLDPDLRRAHQLFPWVTTWDDHESANNSWRDGAGNHTPGAEGDWPVRKGWAQQAYEEWLPIRVDDPARIYRSLRYGELADLIVLDTRLDGRDEQVGSELMVLFEDEVRNPDRQLISPEQREFWHGELSASADRGTRWRIVAQQVMLAPLNVVALPNVEELLGVELPDAPLFLLDGPAAAINPDQWDGYTVERDRFYDHLRAAAIDNVVVLTGDIHTSWASDLTPDPVNPLVAPLGVEFVATSVTSSGFENILGSVEAARVAEPAVQVTNPHIKYVDLTRRGYLLLDVSAERVQGEWYLSEPVQATRGMVPAFAAAWQTVDGSNRLSPGTGPA
nr:alkaline phosphatase D family protein [Acidimicrobiia bacterium]